MIDINILRSIAFFEDHSDAHLEKCAKIAKVVNLDPNTYLNKKSRSADDLYVILEGAVRLEVENDDGSRSQLETLYPGAAIGVSSLIDVQSHEYLSDARTLTHSKLVKFSAEELTNLFSQDYQLGYLIMRKLAMILRKRLAGRIPHLSKFLDFERSVM